MSRLSAAGRYCPHCGLDTYSSPPAALEARAGELMPSAAALAESEWRHLAELSLVMRPISLPPSGVVLPSPESSSLMLRGYSNALYSLGRRYELGAGPARNRREALRCYLKSARLGNFMAFARLSSRWLETHDSAPGSPADPLADDAGPILQ